MTVEVCWTVCGLRLVPSLTGLIPKNARTQGAAVCLRAAFPEVAEGGAGKWPLRGEKKIDG